MEKSRIIPAGLIVGVMLVSVVVSGVEAKGRGAAGTSRGENLRLRDGTCASTPGTVQANPAGQRGVGNTTGKRPMDGTGNGFGNGTQSRPLDGSGFGRGASGN